MLNRRACFTLAELHCRWDFVRVHTSSVERIRLFSPGFSGFGPWFDPALCDTLTHSTSLAILSLVLSPIIQAVSHGLV
jgi:hypothetical protein